MQKSKSKFYIGYYGHKKTYRCPTILRVYNDCSYYIGIFEFCVKQLEQIYDQPTLKGVLKVCHVKFIKI